MNTQRKLRAITYALVAALLYGISSPISKLLLREISPALMAALLYLGAGIGMFTIHLVHQSSNGEEASITVNELPFVVGMILLDIIAPILLMKGLTMTNASTASLLNNFEVVATAIIALMIFKEAIGKRMWLAIFMITLSSIILSVEPGSDFHFSSLKLPMNSPHRHNLK